MNLILVKTRNPRDRYRLIDGSSGRHGTTKNHVNNYFQIVAGIDKGNGYQCYLSVSYFLTLDYVPQQAKETVIQICKERGLIFEN